MKNNPAILEYAFLIVIIIVALVFFLQMKNQDIRLCQHIFQGLIKAGYSVQKFIDWENFKALDVDVGVTYSKLANEEERSSYKKAFIKNFSQGFKQVKGESGAFTHWRIDTKDAEKVVVACDYSVRHKTLLFGLSKIGKTKLTSLQWR